MRLRNKKTGEIKECAVIPIDSNGYPNEYQVFEKGNSLAELNEEWEDYKEPKEYWAIDCFSTDGNLVSQFTGGSDIIIENRKVIGNYFETKEEAEKAVEKLKAWRRLKDKGFRFKGLDSFGNIGFEADDKYESVYLNVYPFRKFEKDEGEFLDDLCLLFGGEE